MADVKIDFNNCNVAIEKMFDIHDNGVVSFSVDKGTVSLDKGEKAQDKPKGKGGRPRRTGKTINKAFRYVGGGDAKARLQMLYNGLIALEWIRKDTDMRNFLSIFSGGETTCKIVWTGDINALAELFQELVNRKQIVKLPEGESIWVMVNARFWDHEGNKEFGNERLGSTRTPRETKDKIDMLVGIMNPDTSLKEIKEMLQSQEI